MNQASSIPSGKEGAKAYKADVTALIRSFGLFRRIMPRSGTGRTSDHSNMIRSLKQANYSQTTILKNSDMPWRRKTKSGIYGQTCIPSQEASNNLRRCNTDDE